MERGPGPQINQRESEWLSAPCAESTLTSLTLFLTCLSVCLSRTAPLSLSLSWYVQISHKRSFYSHKMCFLPFLHLMKHEGNSQIQTFKPGLTESVHVWFSFAHCLHVSEGDSGRMMSRDGPVWSITAEIQSPLCVWEAYGEKTAGYFLLLPPSSLACRGYCRGALLWWWAKTIFLFTVDISYED